jgi:hypothetical protein
MAAKTPPKKAGRPEAFTPDQIIEALRAEHGFVAAAARRLGCAENTIRRYINNYPEVAEVHTEAFETAGDNVEYALYDEAVNQRNTAALIFLAKTRFRNRGYTERQELTGANGGPVAITVHIVDEAADDQLTDTRD